MKADSLRLCPSSFRKFVLIACASALPSKELLQSLPAEFVTFVRLCYDQVFLSGCGKRVFLGTCIMALQFVRPVPCKLEPLLGLASLLIVHAGMLCAFISAVHM